MGWIPYLDKNTHQIYWDMSLVREDYELDLFPSCVLVTLFLLGNLFSLNYVGLVKWLQNLPGIIPVGSLRKAWDSTLSDHETPNVTKQISYAICSKDV